MYIINTTWVMWYWYYDNKWITDNRSVFNPDNQGPSQYKDVILPV